ncbi:prolipoprotein diacylglyceryl transferase [Chitinophaga solisilvae]|uniref:prolipoprotein diacylglyceryl transferase n=1 Tax=Chitinophaga solisilvae TaxID=1233460 RepID=UPI001923FF03|nr:prolipoprotein diacylglyceryl transferase [Chitinophaga solisilvae]
MLMYLTWNQSPEIFRIGGFALRYYSVAFMLAFLLGYALLTRMLAIEQRPRRIADKLAVSMVLGTIAGARLGHAFFYEPAYFLKHPLELILPVTISHGRLLFTGYQGLASHGGAIGILVAVWLFSRKHRISCIWVLDRLAVIIPLAGALIRIGNFFNSEIIGIPSGLPWAVIFQRTDALPRHPAQLYEAASYLLIYIFLIFLYNSHLAEKKPGHLFGAFLVLVFSARLLLEFVKEDQEIFEQGWWLNMGQLLSIPLILCGIYFLIFYGRRYGRKTTDKGVHHHGLPGRG